MTTDDHSRETPTTIVTTETIYTLLAAERPVLTESRQYWPLSREQVCTDFQWLL